MRTLLILALSLTSVSSFAQWGASYYQSDISAGAVSYEFKDRFRGELRIGTNLFDTDLSPFVTVSGDFALSAVFTYDLINKAGYELYTGAGIRASEYRGNGPFLPVGLNMYPFDDKRFGFIMEVAPAVYRVHIGFSGSVGIRYRFLREDEL